MLVGELHSSSAVKRHEQNPIITKEDIPYKAECVFNPGVVKYEGKYVMIFRNDYGLSASGFEGVNLGIATSDDGVSWSVREKPFLTLDDIADDEITKVYDPRLTCVEGRIYICFAVDTKHGLRGGIGVTDDLESLKIISMTVPDNRNMALFPEKIGGRYMRLERPFPVYSRYGKDRFDIWMSASPDMVYWGESRLVMAVEDVPFANDKIGPGAPPVKTPHGWLTVFHAVDMDSSRGKNGFEPKWQKRYTAGVALLDLNEPWRVKGMYKKPLLAPEADYEINGGFRNNVIFPGGVIVEPSGEVKIYYGAADTKICLATADIDDLVRLCL